MGVLNNIILNTIINCLLTTHTIDYDLAESMITGSKELQAYTSKAESDMSCKGSNLKL